MLKISFNALEEDKLINGGFLAVSIAIVISSLYAPISGKQLWPLIICSAAIPPLSFNAFVLEYKKRFEVDIDHWGYHLLSVVGILLTFLGMLIALSLKSWVAAAAFVIGFLFVLPAAFYLDSLVKSNKENS